MYYLKIKLDCRKKTIKWVNKTCMKVIYAVKKLKKDIFT